MGLKQDIIMKYIYPIIAITLWASIVMPIDNSNHDAMNSIVILFTTINEDYPVGQYWPAQKLDVGQNSTMNPSSIFIEPDDWYSDIVQSNIELASERSRYIGFFIDYETNEPIYLYGTKDEKFDSDEESDEDSDS